MKQNYHLKNYLFLTLAVGLLIPAVFVFAQTSGVSTNEAAALQDLSQIAGQEITSTAQAKEICNLERFIADCAAIGKKHNLYKPEEIKTVNAVLAELKGKVVEDLKNCADEACLVDVANRVAKTIAAKNPTVAKQVDLTVAKVEEKRVIVNAAKEAGVGFRQCQAMDLDTASIDLLRACAKLAKDQRVIKYIPEERKQLVQINDSSLQLREALGRGEYQCGDNNTLDGCGNFCLNPAPEARAQGVAAIPQVCRDIATRFFGAEGIKRLEAAYGYVKQAADFYYKRAQTTTFTTPDGKVLFNPQEIGRYLEEEGRKGNVEAVEKGMEFMVAQGFVKPEEKEFAVKMVQKVRDVGGVIDFEVCRRNPRACRQFIPEEQQPQFELMDKIQSVMLAEMNKEGVPGPEVCEDPRYGEKCLIASKRALPQIESIAGNNTEANRIIQDIKQHIEFGEQGFQARERARMEFEKAGGQFVIGNKQFNNFEEVDNFCRVNGQECLVNAAQRGFIDKDFAEKKFEQVVEKRFIGPQFGQPFGPQGPYPGPFPGPLGGSTTTFPGQFPGQGPYPGFIPPGQGGYPPGQIPGFTAPGQGFNLPTGFNKEEALKLFKEWLDNPRGQPPMPFVQYQVPQQVPEGQYPQQPYPQQPYPQQPGQLQPYPYQRFCESAPPQPCPIGQYREVKNDANSCPIYGQCIAYQKPPQYEMATSTLPPKTIPICPALPTVDSCPAGQEKVVAWSSPECGTYYTCKQNEILPPPPPITSGQREQIWNSLGLRSWVRSDADQARIESLKQSCASVPSNANIWMPNAGLSSSQDFGMPDQNKCAQAAGCPSDKYFDGSSCVSSGGVYNTGGSSCSAALIELLGTGCHYMYNDSTSNRIYCDGSMTKSAKEGDTATTSGCSSSFYSNQACPSGQYWNGTTCVNSTTSGSGSTSSQCPSFAHEMSGYCMLNNNTSRCAEYSSASSEANYTSSVCQAHGSGGTYTSGSTSCPSGQYWYVPPDGGAGYCKTSETSGSTTSCPSGQYWNGSACVDSTSGGSTGGSTTDPVTACSQTGGTWNGSSCVFPTTCPSGQYWNGSACVSSCPEGQTWDGSTCVSPPSANISTQHLLAQFFTILRNFSNILESLR